METFKVKDIPENSFFTKPVYLDAGFIIASPEMPVGAALKKLLLEWGFQYVQSEGEPRETYQSEIADQSPGEIGNLIGISVDERNNLLRAERFYHSFQKYAESLYIQISLKAEIRFSDVAEKVKGLCDMVKENHRFLLRSLKNIEAATSQTYLASHGVKSTIIALVIGMYIKLPSHRLIELGVAALLHEVGMSRIPQRVYLNNRDLSDEERRIMLTHPIQSYNILKEYDFPLAVSMAALEHHERENGSGYPRKLSGAKIGLYAKIIAVACSYEALTNSRPHKEAKDGYSCMLDLMKNTGKQYDDTVIRALVYSLSLYPIGLYVLLSNGRKGQVVDINPEDPRFPVVQVFGELALNGQIKTIETSASNISIIRPLSQEEIDKD